MKETINISLSGVSFVIEKDAYDKLSVYIKSLEEQFASNEDGSEIIGDIEARIAEILMEDKSSLSSAITLFDVEKVMKQMGTPDDDFDISQDEEPQKPIVKKKLYRKKDGSVMGGVLNGLAAYFNIDVALLRVIFVVVLIATIAIDALNDITGYIIIAYFILWSIIPVASTVIQKLEMEGGDINVSNINNRYASKEDNLNNTLLIILGKMLKFILIAITIIIGLFILLVLGLVLFVAFMVPVSLNLLPILFSWNPSLSFIAIIMTVGIPLLILLLLFIKILFSVKIKKFVYVVLLSAWLMSVVFMVLSMSYQYNSTSSLETKTVDIFSRKGQVEGKRLFVKMLGDGNETNNPISHELLYNKVYNMFEKSSDSTVRVTLTKSANGANYNKAKELIDNVSLPYEIVGDTLYITTGFTVKDNITSKQRAYYTFYCPENCEIVFDKLVHYKNFKNVVKKRKSKVKIKEVDAEKAEQNYDINIDVDSVNIKGTVKTKNVTKDSSGVVDVDIEINKQTKNSKK